MRCLIIPRRHLIYCFVLFLSFFFTLYFSSSSFASSVDCGEVISYVTLSSSPNISFSCDTSSLDSSKVWFYSSSFTYSQNSSHGGTSPFLSFSNSVFLSIKTSFARLDLSQLSGSGSSIVSDIDGYHFDKVVPSNLSSSSYTYFTFSLSLVIFFVSIFYF